ncbi:MAG: M48 family metalloprotease, partial [Pseudomonadota bacterium]
MNAFALPGADSEAEVASVLGHEVGHVTARHAARRVTRAALAQAVGVLAAIGGAGARLSRQQECEADLLGIRDLARAGCDATASADVLTTLERKSALDAAIAGRRARTGGFFATHPATFARVRAAIEAVRGRGVRIDPGAPRRRAAHLAAIDGTPGGDGSEGGPPPRMIRVVRARPGDDVAAFAARRRPGPPPERRFRVVNGLGPSDPLPADGRVKIVVARRRGGSDREAAHLGAVLALERALHLLQGLGLEL